MTLPVVRWLGLTIGSVWALGLLMTAVVAEQQPVRFGGDYASLEPRCQQFVDDWTKRFTAVTGQHLASGPFYDDILPLSTKTTFDAITHALMTSSVTTASGDQLGDALSLVERVEAVRGEVPGAKSDRQFRMYVRLVPDALGKLSKSREFKRGADNSVYHKGYPKSYREQSGVPSIQFSVALDNRRADIDVDYRASTFPAALFNGHLTASNSDVRAGNNYGRHVNRWGGFQNWWRSFFGVRQQFAPDTTPSGSPLVLPKTPRVGNKNVEVMMHDFLNAWLVEGDVVAAMGYVSERSYACLAQDSDSGLVADYLLRGRAALTGIGISLAASVSRNVERTKARFGSSRVLTT